jgi:hypothetical protein
MLARKPFIYFFKDLILLIGVIEMLDKLYSSFNSTGVYRIL